MALAEASGVEGIELESRKTPLSARSNEWVELKYPLLKISPGEWMQK